MVAKVIFVPDHNEAGVNKAEELSSRLVIEKQYTEILTLESGSSQEQNDDFSYWDESGTGCGESGIVDNTVIKNSFIPENSVLMEVGIPLTESEKVLIDEFYKKMENILKTFRQRKHENPTKAALESMEHLIDEYLRKKIKLNLRCGNYEHTVSNFVLEKIIDIANNNSGMRITSTTRSRYKDNGEEALDEWTESTEVLFSVISKLLLAGAKIRSDFYGDGMVNEIMFYNDELIFAKCEEIKNKLKSIAYESLVNKNEQAKVDDITVEVDNNLILFQWPQNSIVEVAKIINSKVDDNLNIESGILQIGKSIIRVESVGEKRNYTDVLEGSIEMSFTTEIGKIGVYFSPSDEDSNKIKVELNEESQEKFDKLKDQSSLGKNCLLGGKSVLQAIKDGGFKRNGSVSIELAETIKQSNCVVKEFPSTAAPGSKLGEISCSQSLSSLRSNGRY